MRVHLDTDFLVRAVMAAGSERDRLLALAESDAEIGMSAIAWFEFARGPRSPEELALASLFIEDEDVVPWTAELANLAADTFRALGMPRRRANDIAIATTALACGAVLWTANGRDFDDVPGVRLGP